MTSKKITRQDLREAAEKYKNWGKWGADDEIGTLNYTRPEDIVAAARLVRKGKVISLALNFDHTGPQGAKSNYPAMGRTNPIHTMIRTGTDAITNKVISAQAAAAGSRLPAGCSRTTAAVFFRFVRIRSAPSATASCGIGNPGPQPRLASCRSLRSTALRCVPVSPGSR